MSRLANAPQLESEQAAEAAPNAGPVAGLPTSSLSSTDLAELMSAFTDVTTKLEHTHAQLRSEVSRLTDELYQANEALERSRRLAALGEMAAGISHEIRNPLGSITLYAKMLADDLEAMPEQCQIVQKIGRAVRGLDEIVGDVLTFARELKTNPHPCESSSLIEHALEMCHAEIERSSVVVRSENQLDSIELLCDPTLLQQALINVIRNACEANRVAGGQTLIVDSGLESIKLSEASTPCVVFRVQDQGDGMPPEVVERMFNPFFTTRDTGTGLGLAIVHRIVDAHRGKIEVSKPATGGACVKLFIPREPSLVVSRSEPASDAGEIIITHGQRAHAANGVC